jgi:hypothetical protein
MSDVVPTEAGVIDVKEWNVEPIIINIQTSSGQPVECVVSPYLKPKTNVLHIYSEQKGIQYDIPTEGTLNLVVNTKADNELVPVGAMSLDVEQFVPTVKMIQQVKAFEKTEEAEEKPDDKISFGPVYEKVRHPAQEHMQGENKMDWRGILLQRAEELAKTAGFNSLRIISGFNSRYLEGGYPLGLATQQYDRLVANKNDWTAFNSDGIPINDPEQRKLLNSTIRKLRDGDIKTIDEVKKVLPSNLIPAYYQKGFENS